MALAVVSWAQDLSAHRAGVMRLEVDDPVHARRAPVLVIYPTSDAAADTQFGEYRIGARENARLAPGKFPLIILSHGHGGSRFGHHDLAVALAREGFIVAALDHLGDNVQEAAEPISASVLFARPRQVSALIDTVLAHEHLSSRVDGSKIGVVGFSAGGFTALALAGAVPNLELWRGYCNRPAASDALCPPPRDADRVGQPARLRDDRIRAVYVMAPFGVLFGAQELTAVTVPIRIVGGAQDLVLPVEDHVDPLQKHLPQHPRPWIVADAAHFTFLAPCSPTLRTLAPEICEDPPGVDRAAIHERINSDALRFFIRHLYRAR